MIDLFLALVELILILGAAAGLASVFSDSRRENDPLSNPIISMALGLGILSYLTLLLAACHILTSWFFWGILVTGNILFYINRKKLKIFRLQPRITPLVAILGVYMAVNLFYSLFPPTFYDSLLYHLAIPQYYLHQGGIVPWNCNFNSNLPLNGEMLYLFTLLGGTVHIPKLISLLSGIAIILLMFQWYRKRFNASYPLLPSLLFYTIPQVGFLTSSSKTDLLGMLFLFSGLHVLSIHIEHPRNSRNLVITGIFWGLALGTKYIFAFTVFAFLIAIFFLKGIGFKRKLLACLLISLMVLACLTPWFVKNTVICGNPVYPYLNSLFKSESWSTEQAANFSATLKRDPRASIFQLLYYPVELFLKPYKYGMTAVWGILFMLLSPLLLLSLRNAHLRFLILSSLLAFATLLLFARVPRYFLSSLMLLSIPLAQGLETVFKKLPGIRKILITVIAAVMGVHLILQVDLQEKFFKGFQFLKKKIFYESPGLTYLNIIPYHPAASFINRELPVESRIMLLGEDRSFYIGKNHFTCSFADRHPFLESLKKNHRFSRIRAVLKERSITHILYSEKGLTRLGGLSQTHRLSPLQRERLDRYLEKLETLYKDNWCRLLKIDRPPTRAAGKHQSRRDRL